MDLKQEQQQIKKGFNRGYLLAKYRPELTERILKGMQHKNDPYYIGLSAGVKEYQSEKSRHKTITRKPNYKIHPKSVQPSKSKPKDISKDR